jgi:hypothetical protein
MYPNGSKQAFMAPNEKAPMAFNENIFDMGGDKEGENGLNFIRLGNGGLNGLFRSPSTQPKATYTGPVLADVKKTMLASMGLTKGEKRNC